MNVKPPNNPLRLAAFEAFDLQLCEWNERLISFQEGTYFRRHAQVPERCLRGGTRLRLRAGQLSEGQKRGDVSHQASGASQVSTKAVVEAEGLDGGRAGRE